MGEPDVSFHCQPRIWRIGARNYIRSISTTAPKLSDQVVDMPTSEEQSTGRKREELLAAMRGEVRFDRAPTEQAFGTLENPVMVKSGFNSRIVGFQGGIEGGPKYHEVMWFNLERSDIPSVCSLCGQVFKLVDAGVNDPAAAGMVGEL